MAYDSDIARPFLGLNFRSLSVDEAVAQVAAQAGLHHPLQYVVTPNVDHRVRLEREPALAYLYRDAWLTVCDSRILALMSRLDGANLKAAPGSDIVERLFSAVLDRDEPVTIVGGRASTIALLKQRFGLTDIRWHDAPAGLRHKPDAIAEAARFIADNPCRFVFVAVGSPQQEMVAHAAFVEGRATGVALCCGVSLEYLTGEVGRAPLWMRKASLEWLHRLASEPGRLWKRYLVDGPRIFAIWLKTRSTAAA